MQSSVSPTPSRLQTTVREIFLLAAGVGAATIGLKGFLLPNDLLDGGVTGTSLLLERLTGWNISVLLGLLNLPFIVIAARQVSRTFAVKSAACIFTLVVAIKLVTLPHITNDKLLIAVFGGFFIGAGIGLAIRGGGVVDGTEVMAVAIARKSTLSVGDVISIFNVVLFATSALLFNIETAMYSMLTYLSASKTADFLVTGIEEYIGVTIVSHKAEELKSVIVERLGRAVTVYKSEGGFGKTGLTEDEGRILFSVVTRLEVQRLLKEIERVDPAAFIAQHTVNDTRGGLIKQRPLH